ncbi:hypothetical protein U9M48_005295 [Paspalum notatum var. saurae]|uniref:Uncharacterized protein n=1 Tax=Paspalum notatum var. saurae TaxID=547442 RepID=A0AAQ3PLJ8_PASNO
MAEIATMLAPPQVVHLAEAALCCLKDEMLHLLTKKHPTDFPSLVVHDMAMAAGAGSGSGMGAAPAAPCSFPAPSPEADDTIEAHQAGPVPGHHERAAVGGASHDKQQQLPWALVDMIEGLAGMYAAYNPDERRSTSSVPPAPTLGTSMWSHQSLYSGSLGTEAATEKGNDSVGNSGGDEEGMTSRTYSYAEEDREDAWGGAAAGAGREARAEGMESRHGASTVEVMAGDRKE